MNQLRFKTNINCANCTARVTPILNKSYGASNWTIDTSAPEKLLTVASENATPQDVIGTLKRVGFTAEELE